MMLLMITLFYSPCWGLFVPKQEGSTYWSHAAFAAGHGRIEFAREGYTVNIRGQPNHSSTMKENDAFYDHAGATEHENGL